MEGLMLKLKLQHFGYLMQIADLLEKTLMLGKIEGRRRRGVTGDEMVGWHHRLNGHEFEQTPRDNEGQGSLSTELQVGHDRATEQSLPICQDSPFILSFLCSLYSMIHYFSNVLVKVLNSHSTPRLI